MIDRKELIEERILREAIRKAIHVVSEKKRREQYEENLLRLAVRRSLLSEKVAPLGSPDNPHPITAMNFVYNTLKSILGSVGQGYKSLSSSKEQRDAYAAQLLDNIDSMLSVVNDNPEAVMNAMKEALDISVTDEDIPELGPLTPEEEEAADAEEKAEEEAIKTAEEEEDISSSLDGVGLDETGRNVANRVFKQIKNAIAIDYRELDPDSVAELPSGQSAPERKVYHDFLLKILKDHMLQTFEGQLSADSPIPETPLAEPGGMPQEAPPGNIAEARDDTILDLSLLGL